MLSSENRGLAFDLEAQHDKVGALPLIEVFYAPRDGGLFRRIGEFPQESPLTAGRLADQFRESGIVKRPGRYALVDRVSNMIRLVEVKETTTYVVEEI